MSELTWTADSATLGELVPWERNPKAISKRNAERLLDYWRRIGQFQTVAIGPQGEVYDGHQRLSVLKATFGPSYRIDVRRASRPLSEAEREELVIAAHAGTVGQWDWDALSSWEVGTLKEWGLDEATLHEWNDDAANLREMIEAEDGRSLADAIGGLPDGAKVPFQQMTFTLRDEQVVTVREALKTSRALGDFTDTGNENGNGNALARICELFLGEHGQG